VEQFEEELEQAIMKAKRKPLDLRQRPNSESKFYTPINGAFSLKVKRTTDRIEERPVKIHLYLLTVERNL
jgi:hypothetical protein